VVVIAILQQDTWVVCYGYWQNIANQIVEIKHLGPIEFRTGAEPPVFICPEGNGKLNGPLAGHLAMNFIMNVAYGFLVEGSTSEFRADNE
jgi:hypothetical protein